MNAPLRRLTILCCLALLAACTPAPPTPTPQASPGATRTPQRPSGATATPRAGPAATPRPTQPPAPPDASATPAAGAAFFDDRRLTYEPGFYAPEIQAFLDTQPGLLKALSLAVGDRRHSFAEALVSQTSYYSINPRVILALLETQSRLVTTPGPSAEQIAWAMGFHGENGNRRGLQAQIRWAVRQIVYAKRDYPRYADLEYADGSKLPPPPGMSLSEYVIARVLAPTTTPGNVTPRMQRFLEIYTALFDDPRRPPEDWPPPAAPFLTRPNERTVPVTSFFDHDAPFLTRDPQGAVTTYWGRAEVDMAFAYDGHDGWDYAAAAPDRALAAADGLVVFAGNADDGCATRAVVLDHGNGYRTLYWHLARVDAELGQRVARGEALGIIGNTGCSLGPHLHFGVQYLGRNVDPYGWCGAEADPWAQHPAGGASVWLWLDRPSPCAPPPPGSVVIDADMPGFFTAGDGWQAVQTGYGGSALFSPSVVSQESEPWELRALPPPAVAVWRPKLSAGGRYRVLAYVPYALSGLEDPRKLRYRVRHAGGESEIVINGRVYANDWADLGIYDCAGDGDCAVVLSNQVEENRLSVWADAVMWIPAEAVEGRGALPP